MTRIRHSRTAPANLQTESTIAEAMNGLPKMGSAAGFRYGPRDASGDNAPTTSSTAPSSESKSCRSEIPGVLWAVAASHGCHLIASIDPALQQTPRPEHA